MNKKEIKIMKTAVNFESLKQALTMNPKLIHFSCHGDFDQNLKEFYLLFEQRGTGIADKFNQSRLNELLGKDNN